MGDVPDDRALTELIELGFDYACGRPLSDFVDPDRLIAALDAASTPERVGQWVSRHAAPWRARLLERGRASTQLLGAWLPADVADELAELLAAPVHVPRAVIDELVASEQVRDAVRTLLQETLSNFVSKATAATSAGTGGLRGALGLGARAVGAAGRGLLGGIGDEIQRQLQDRVRDFVDNSVAAMQARIGERLAREETARALGAQRRRALRRLLKTREADAARWLERLPWARLDAMVPRVVAHNAARAEARDALHAEVRAALAELSREPIGALLEQAGLREAAREAARSQGLALARGFVATPGFAAWWARAPR